MIIIATMVAMIIIIKGKKIGDDNDDSTSKQLKS